jgi:hypothetical protein
LAFFAFALARAARPTSAGVVGMEMQT